MKQRSVRDARKDREVHREGWADLGRVDFQVKATAAATFGQPYVAPCVEQLIKGPNVLKDPGFENHAGVPDGVDGFDFPGDGVSAGGANPGSLYWWDRYITDDFWYNGQGWATWSNNTEHGYGQPELSTVNPRSGQYHWRVFYPAGDHGSVEAFPVPLGGRYCDLHTNGLIQGYSARCEPGDTITASFHGMVDPVPVNGVEVYIEIEFYDTDANYVTQSSYDSQVANLGGSYSKREMTRVAPDGAWTALVNYGTYIIDSSAAATYIDIDDCVLGVEA